MANDAFTTPNAQSEKGYADNFDASRALSAEEMAWWIDAIARTGDLDKSSWLLDGGCGTGRFAIPLRSAIGCTVVGIDSSTEMLRAARSKSLSVTWIDGDLLRLAEDLPRNYLGRFDCVFISSVIQQIRNLDLLFEQCRLALKASGKILIRTITPEALMTVDWYQFFPRALQFELARTHSRESVCRSLEQVGFTATSILRAEGTVIVALQDILRRFAKKGFSWSGLYTEAEFAECLTSMQRGYAEKKYVTYEHPTTLFVAERRPRLAQEGR